jgi:hypothetical protein
MFVLAPDRLGPEDDQVTEYSPGSSMGMTCPMMPSLENRPRDILDTPPPLYSAATTIPDAICHANNAVPQHQEENDQNIQELFTILQTPRGVTNRCFWQIFCWCSFCSFITKKNGPHRCLPVMDLTINDDEEMPDIINLTRDDNEIDQ